MNPINYSLKNKRSLVTRRGTLLMESALFRDFFGNFSTRGESYYFRVEGSTRGVFETNIGKLGTRKNSNFFFGWRGALVGVAGCGGPD